MKNRVFQAGLLLLPVLGLVAWAVFGLDPDRPPDVALFLGRFHPLLVHLPIGFLLLAVVLEAFGRRPAFADLRPAVPFVLLAGAVGAVMAAGAGLLLSLEGGYDENVLSWHKRLGIGVAVIAVLAYAARVRLHRQASAASRIAYTGVLVGLTGALVATSHLGGSLTHGPEYLTDYLPGPFRQLAGLPPRLVNPLEGLTDVGEAVLYRDVVHPVLAARCTNCHNPTRQKGDLRLDEPEAILRGGETGEALVPGDAEASELYRRVTLPPGHEDHMPPEGKKQLTDEQVRLLGWWIESGASFDARIAEVEVPEDVQVILNRLTGTGLAEDEGVFALDVPPADPAALRQATGSGLAVVPVAHEQPFLEARAGAKREAFGDAQLEALLPLAPQITWLDLARTAVTDDGLAALARMEHLTRLHLQKTAVTDAGLAHLKNLNHLESLNLYGTRVTDAGLPHLAGLKRLKTLYLWQTAVTPEAADRLARQLPGLQIDLGWRPAPGDTLWQTPGDFRF